MTTLFRTELNKNIFFHEYGKIKNYVTRWVDTHSGVKSIKKFRVSIVVSKILVV